MHVQLHTMSNCKDVLLFTDYIGDIGLVHPHSYIGEIERSKGKNEVLMTRGLKSWQNWKWQTFWYAAGNIKIIIVKWPSNLNICPYHGHIPLWCLYGLKLLAKIKSKQWTHINVRYHPAIKWMSKDFSGYFWISNPHPAAVLIAPGQCFLL